MKIRIKKKDLYKNLIQLKRVSSRSPYPVILIEAKEELFLTATDLTVTIKKKYNAKILKPGSALLPGKKFYDLVKSFPTQAEIEIEKAEERIRVSAQGTNVVFYGPDSSLAEEIPVLPVGKEVFKVGALTLKDMIKKTLPTISTDPLNYPGYPGLATGIYCEISRTTLSMYSTDRTRLSVVETMIENEKEIDTLLIPESGGKEILKFLRTKGDVYVYVDGDRLIVQEEGNTLSIKCKYDSISFYKQLIPDRNSAAMEITVNRTEFLSMLERISIVSERVYIQPDTKESVRLQTSGREVNEVSTASCRGLNERIIFNPNYLFDTLKTMKSDEIKINWFGDISPCVIEGRDDSGFLSVIMTIVPPIEGY